MRQSEFWMRIRSAGALGKIAAASVVVAAGRPALAVPQCDQWQPAAIVPRQGHAMAFDSQRGVTVLFGGQTVYGPGPGTLSDETWELTGDAPADWVRRDVAGPSARAGATMCFDEARGVAVLFGGSTGSAHSSETWEYDGQAWTLRTAGGPSPRSEARMVFDSSRNVCVLYGGQTDSVGGVNETWEWNGSDWVYRATVGGPGGRFSHGMAYDSARAVTVLYGGYGGGSTFNNSTWEYDGTQWLLRDDQSVPSNAALSMAYDAVHQRVVWWGGDPFGGIGVWNGTAWTPAPITFNAPAGAYLGGRMNAALVHDSARGVLVHFGGFDGNNSLWGDTWEWSGEGAAVWRNPSLHGVDDAQMAVYDADRHVTAVYKQGEMWEFDGAMRSWLRRPAGGLPDRHDAVMAYDSARQVYVVFGGRIGAGAGVTTNETWEWSPATGTWQFRSNTGPSPRWGHAMAFDSVRNLTVLFGGRSGSTFYQGTWEWNGTAWNPRSETGPARVAHELVFDPVRNRTLLFGGSSGGVYHNDLWEWNGVSGQWAPVAASDPPPARSEHRMVYDSQNDRFLLFGGYASSPGSLNDFWAYDADIQAWTLLAAQTPMSRRSMHAMVFDSDRGVAVVLGGWSLYGRLRDHWETCAQPLCAGDIAPAGGDGQVNVDDMLSVLNAWGPCPAPPANCDADIAPAAGDGQVNVDDLLVVINSWGGCP